VLYGNDGSDTASYRYASTGVTASLVDPGSNTGEAAGDAYFSIENLSGSTHDDSLLGDGKANVLTGLDGADELAGLGGNDVLVGGLGNDTLKGGDGDYRLVGGHGQDTLRGGDGSNTFVFEHVAGSNDTVKDFVSGVDRIEISAAEFGGGLVAGALDPNAFAVNTTGNAGDADDRFLYDSTDGRLYFDADGNGAGARELVAKLIGAVTLQSSDFLIV